MAERQTIETLKAIVDRVEFLDRRFLVLEKGNGFLLQLEYMEPDVENPGGDPIRQSSRKYYVSPYSTESEIVETAWLAVTRSQQHVASEHFTYRGRRVYSQHFDVNARVALCDRAMYDKR